jgi:flagellar biosynthesis protein FlhF
MRIRTLTAPKMADALTIIRQELGPEALILSTRKVTNAQGEPTLEITAAVNEPEPATKPVEALPSHKTSLPAPSTHDSRITNHDLSSILRHHGVAEALITKLTAALPGLHTAGFSPAEALEMLLSKLATFTPAADALKPGAAHLFIGPPGAGKTTLVSKLAVQARQNGRKVGILSLDDQKLGGFEPLAITAENLGDTAHLLTGPAALKTAAQTLGPRHFLLIDTPALNPYQPQAFTQLKQKLESLGLPTICHLVVPADLNADDMGLLPVATHRFNPASLIITKLDCTTRYGAVLNTASASGLPLGLASHNGNVATAPLNLTPQWLGQALGTLPRQPWEFTS